MRQKPNFQQISRQELRKYVLTHREDEEALRIYMERLRNESDVNRYRGGLDERDFQQLEHLLAEKSDHQ